MTKLYDLCFKKKDISRVGQMELDQNMLTLLLALDENKTLLQVAKETKMDAAMLKNCLLKIYKLGLIEEVRQRVEYVEAGVLENIRQTLVDLLGPLGEILMNDVAQNMQVQLPKVPKTALAEFLNAIKNEIPGKKEQMEFQKRLEGRMLN